jgi:TPR repeat protein
VNCDILFFFKKEGDCLSTKPAGISNTEWRQQIQESAKRGEAEGQYQWGHELLRCGDSGGYSWLGWAAKQDHTEALVELGQRYEYANDLPEKVPVTAFLCYEKAARLGSPEGRYRLGFCYEKGIGTCPRPKAAVYWYHQAALGGYDDALLRIGLCYERGIGVPRTRMGARFYYQLGAERGNARTQTILARWYMTCQPPDYKAASPWLEKAADQRDPDALYLLSLCYKNGRGVVSQPDVKRARQLLKWAAKAGHEEASKQLGWV